MSKGRKARQAEARKKAIRNKIILASVLAMTVIAIVLAVLLPLQPGSVRDPDRVLDLSALSQTMLVAEVNRITAQPERYEGRTIKMSGPYYSVFNEQLDRYQHFVAVAVVDSCCPFQGLEFIKSGDNAASTDYPDKETRINVAGIFQSHEEQGRVYHTISVEDIEILG